MTNGEGRLGNTHGEFFLLLLVALTILFSFCSSLFSYLSNCVPCMSGQWRKVHGKRSSGRVSGMRTGGKIGVGEEVGREDISTCLHERRDLRAEYKRALCDGGAWRLLS